MLSKGSYAEQCYRTVRDAIADLENGRSIKEVEENTGIKLVHMNNLSELATLFGNADVFRNHIEINATDIAMERFEA